MCPSRELSAGSSTIYPTGIENSPPTFVLSSTLLKFCRQMGQLLARSTHGFKHSSCRLCPQGNKWAIISGSWSSDRVGDLWVLGTRPPCSSSSDLTARTAGWGRALALLRSPRQTIQVSDMVVIDGSEFWKWSNR